MIAGFASVLEKQARGTVLLEATQQTKHLTPLQADQHTGVSNTQTPRLNPQQHLKPAELLLAHRQHRQGAPPGTPEPGGVSPLSCRGVSSLYCAYTQCRRKIEMAPGAQSRDDTPGWRRARRARPELHRCSESRAAYLIASLDQD